MAPNWASIFHGHHGGDWRPGDCYECWPDTPLWKQFFNMDGRRHAERKRETEQ